MDPKKRPPPENSLQLTDDQMCFGCGSLNTRGLKLSFDLDKEKKVIRSTWTPTKEFQGYADVLHGGITALILDELMGNLLYLTGTPAVAVELSVRFHKPGKMGEPIDFEARFKSKKGRVFEMEADARNPAGKPIASSSGKYIWINK